jgi:hypothetical protein
MPHDDPTPARYFLSQRTPGFETSVMLPTTSRTSAAHACSSAGYTRARARRGLIGSRSEQTPKSPLLFHAASKSPTSLTAPVSMLTLLKESTSTTEPTIEKLRNRCDPRPNHRAAPYPGALNADC